MKEMNEYTYNTIKEVPLSAMMSTIHRHHSIYINRRLKDIGLTSGLYGILLCIYDDYKSPKSQQDIAKRLNMNDGTIAKALRKLEDKNMIQRSPNPDNRRQNLISLTDTGLNIAEEFNNLDEKWEKDVFEGLTSDEIIDLKWDLHRITLNSIEKIK
ncbi:MAG: MarR family transcriptional regulator [Methanobrevibacter sp.]|jgi:DNA-binding MarR family transcriptional regulator|nr:MarR family transcriptional regulator [Methanobrevibacter sp.]MEE3443995.1 MarR family transcriptional regulator [Methanobrevibacter sp.]